MADNEWNGGVYPPDPGLPKLLLLSLERIGVASPPEYLYREYELRSTFRCEVMIFVSRSTLYPDVSPWYTKTTGYRFADTYHKAARKALRHLRVIYKHHLRQTPMGFFPPAGGRGRSWIARMRRLGREEEELEDTVSHLSIYLTGLDKLYRETAAQLKEQTRRAEGAEKALIAQTEKVVKAEEKAEIDQRAYEGLWQAFAKAREEARQAEERAA